MTTYGIILFMTERITTYPATEPSVGEALDYLPDGLHTDTDIRRGDRALLKALLADKVNWLYRKEPSASLGETDSDNAEPVSRIVA